MSNNCPHFEAASRSVAHLQIPAATDATGRDGGFLLGQDPSAAPISGVGPCTLTTEENGDFHLQGRENEDVLFTVPHLCPQAPEFYEQVPALVGPFLEGVFPL